MQSSVLDENRRDRALARVELGFNNSARRAAVRIRLEIENLRLQQNLIEEGVDVRALLGGDLAG